MSDQPRDEDELQALLAGESALSRRYRELSDEQPPAQIDAAILASSRWAVGADSRGSSSRRASADRTDSSRTDSRSTGSQHTDSHGTGSRHTGSSWRRSSFMRWGAPLAMAAVVVVAVALTITIERDPETDRIYDRYDKQSADMRESGRVGAAGKSEIALSEAPAPASLPASSDVSAPPSAAAPLRAPASPSSQVAGESAQLNEQRNIAARKRSAQLQQELAANRAVERDAAGLVAADIKANAADEQKAVVKERVVDAAKPAEAFPGSDDAPAINEPSAVADIAAENSGSSRDEFAVAGASTSSDAQDPVESEELMKSAAEPSPGRQQSSTLPADGEPVVAQQLADQDTSAPLAETEVMRDPETWIQEIEDLLADGKGEEALDSLKKFRLDYPDYQLPEDLRALIPAQ